MSVAPKLTCTKLEISGRVATFTLNRPEALNALSWDMREDFKALVAFLDGNEAIGALVLAGEGRAFCAGGDVTTMTSRLDDGPGQSRQRILDVHQWLLRLHNIDCPVIAAVDGLAFGGGFSLALAADLVFASEKAKFCAVFARIGLMPDMGLAYTLPRLVGPQMAKDLMFTGRSIDVTEAKALGLVHSVYPAGEVLAAAQAYAARLVEGLQRAVRSRHLIGMAQGMIMQRYGVDMARAFAVLQRWSSHRNLPLREVAEAIVEGREPLPEP